MCFFLKQGLIESLHLTSSAGCATCVSCCQKCMKISTKKLKLAVVILNNGLGCIDHIENRRIVDLKVNFHQGKGYRTAGLSLLVGNKDVKKEVVGLKIKKNDQII